MKEFFYKIWNFVVSIPQDKLLHFAVSAVITAIAILLFKLCGFGKESCAYGWLVGFAFGMGREIYDEITKKDSESGDWLYDAVAFTGVALYSLFLML